MATDAERYWAKVATGDNCWEWTGARNDRGYGLFWIGRWTRAHRYSWEMANGPIPAGRVVRHRCDNPPCVRPDHLEVGTQRDNLADMTARGRRARGERHPWFGQEQRGEANRQSKLTSEQVAHIRGMAEAGHYHDDIARWFGVTRATVTYIAVGRTWTAVEPVLYPPAVRDRPLGRSSRRKRVGLGQVVRPVPSARSIRVNRSAG